MVPLARLATNGRGQKVSGVTMLMIKQKTSERKVAVGTKGIKPSTFVSDDGKFWLYQFTAPVLCDETFDAGTKKTYGAKIGLSVADNVELLTKLDDELLRRYGKGVIYCLNYGIDLAARGQSDADNRIKKDNVADRLSAWLEQADVEVLVEAKTQAKLAGLSLVDYFKAHEDELTATEEPVTDDEV